MKLIELTQGKKVAIDDADWDLVRPYKWRWQKPSERAKDCEGYAVCSSGDLPKSTIMSRLIMDAKRGEVVTYRDNNSLNCQRENLIKGNQGLASMMSGRSGRSKSGYRGVEQISSGFRAVVRINNVRHQSPAFRTIVEANDWAVAKRAELHGEMAWDGLPISRKRAA